MALEDLVTELLSATIRLATPIVIAAIGELFAERSGVMNLGVEGMMLLAAIFGLIGTFFTQNLWMGVLLGMLAGGLVGLFFAYMTVTLRVNQATLGIALGFLGTGLSGLLVYGVFHDFEVSPSLRFGNIGLPVLSGIPVLGQSFFNQNILIYFAYVMVPVSAFILSKTTFGLKIRSVGENPRAADSVGINVSRIRYICTVLGGMMAGLAGSYMILAYVSTLSEDIIGGRGWMAIALVIFGSWNAYYIFFGALLFGGVSALQISLQTGAGSYGAYTFLYMLPYLVSLVSLTVVTRTRKIRKKAVGPEALSKPYIREEAG